MTIADVAYAAQVDWSYLTHLESGRKNPSLDVMDALAHALGVQLKDLLHESTDVNAVLTAQELTSEEERQEKQ